jgi:pimeloyl-ACP methyl ester carboxylesterase
MNGGREVPGDLAHDRAGPRGEATILLLHAGVADRTMWEPQWGPLSRRHDVVRLDFRGFGESTARRDPAVGAADDVAALLDRLGVATCHVVGASYGAGVAAELALERPDLVRSLLLSPPGGSLFVERTETLWAFAEAEHDALQRGDLDAAVDANVSTWVVGPGRRAPDVDEGVQDAVRRMQRRVFELQEPWGDDVDEREVEPPAVERLGDLRCPVQVLVGAHDVDAAITAADLVSTAVPGAVRVDWPDVAHLPSMEQPERFLDLLERWTSVAEHG